MLLRRIKDFAEKLFFILIIEFLRLFSKHDTYLVAGQINLKSLDPIDSWTFFRWLQDHNIPSRYLIAADAEFYLNCIHGKGYKDIIVLPADASSSQILHYLDCWRHARAFVVEWNMLNNTLDYWLKHLHGMRYVLLQHGIIGAHTSNILTKGLLPFNDINVSSLKEKQIVESIPGVKPDTCFVAGLPRFEFLHNESDNTSTQKTLFVMFTWRNFPKGMSFDEIQQTYFWKGINALISDENIERFRRQNIRIVMALHHSLLSSVPNLQSHPNVIIAGQKDIKYWITHADGFLTDFSSVIFDFLFIDKPVILWIPDLCDPTLDPNDVGYGNKVLSAIERRKEFFNTVDSLEEAMLLVEHYATNGFVLETEKRQAAQQWFAHRSDFSQKVYEAIEQRLV